jgi:hypothetical protein
VLTARAPKGRLTGRLDGGDVDVGELQCGGGHRLHEGTAAERGGLGGDGEEVLVKVRRHDVAAGHAGRLAERGLGLLAPLVQRGAVHGFEALLGEAGGLDVAGAGAGDGEQPVAEGLAAGIVALARAEDAVAAGLFCGAGDLTAVVRRL